MILKRLANIAGKPFGINPFPRAFANASVSTSDREQAFEQIFEEEGWNGSESVSGPGSDAARAEPYRRRLAAELDRLEAKSVLDAPCGDLNWILPAMAGRTYIGADISPSLIQALRTTHPDLDLRQLDICEDPLPKADVWHCRDCLFHLPFADIERALDNFLRSGIPYAMFTTHHTRLAHENLDIPVGGWRYLDLRKAPISLPRPIAMIRDYRIGRDFPRFVGVWTHQQVATRRSSNPALQQAVGAKPVGASPNDAEPATPRFDNSMKN